MSEYDPRRDAFESYHVAIDALREGLERDKASLARLADIAERMDGDKWGMVAAETMAVTTRRATGEEVVLCTFATDALPDEIDLIAGALDDLRLFLRSRSRAAKQFRDMQRQLGREEQRLREGDFAANAAMLCNDRPFQRFLEEKTAGGPVRDSRAADTRLKSVLAIASKTQLNEDAGAQRRWLALRGDYQNWLRGGR